MSRSRAKGHIPQHQTESKRFSRRTAIAVLGLVVIVAGGLFLFIRSNQPAPFVPEVTGAPSASIDQEYFDYGDVHYQTTVETAFRVRNVGDQPLYIIGEPRVEVVEGCCPPQTVVSSKVVNSGDEATVSLQFSMHEGMGGQHEFRVHVLTNDPEQPDKQVVIRSNWIA